VSRSLQREARDTATSSNRRGALIVNADDWGQDRTTTRMIAECVQAGSVTAVSAMVFMAGSEEAADYALEHRVDAGLHLNFTTPFSGPHIPFELADRHAVLIRYLRSSRLAQLIYHPGLRSSFDYVVRAQIDEFQRLYRAAPSRFDGHHHMHLCANVRRLMPHGTLVRRSFSFLDGEKGALNRLYRQMVNNGLKQRHQMVDFLFSFAPLWPDRLRWIGELSRNSVVELETHPVNSEEYEVLRVGALHELLGPIDVESFNGVFGHTHTGLRK
jgi:hypothetical protein